MGVKVKRRGGGRESGGKGGAGGRRGAGRSSRKDRSRGTASRGRPARSGTRSRPSKLAAEGVLAALRGKHRPLLSAPAILRELGAGRDAIRALRPILKELEQTGKIERVERRYRLRRRDGRVEGRFAAATGPGASGGSVTEESGAVWRVEGSGGAEPGARVLLQPIGDPARLRGEIVDVLGGDRSNWVGIFHRGAGKAFVTPYRDDGDWLVAIARGASGGAQEGEVVVVEPVRPPQQRERKPRRARAAPPAPPRGRVSERLGPPGHPDADFRAIVWRRRLRVDFPHAVREEADALAEEWSPAEIARRTDLRDRPFVTIDPATARDHDDALCVEPVGSGGFRLWVAIADVAAFVPEGSAIDREALRRGNSIYFPDRAIPMLPERLSGDLCSLRPDVDRLAWVAELVVAAGGKVREKDFYPAVIRSRARLVYEEVADVMEGRSDGGFAREIVEQLRELARATAVLRRHREAAGALELDLPEPDIVFGPDGGVADIVAHPRTLAHRAVEDAMLAANRAVAEALAASGLPAIYRNHEPPLPQDEAALRELFETFGLSADASRGRRRARGSATAGDAAEAGPGWIAAALKQAHGRSFERLVNQTVLRAMTQARYGADCRGHFALAFSHYTHFTSPIRRYSDLVVHRALQQLVATDPGRRGRPAKPDRLGLERMQRIAARTSWRERVAVDAEREAVDLQKCAFLASRVGEEYSATMTGAAPFGLWLTLDDHFVEGLVHVSTLSEFVEYDERRHSFTAQRSGERFELGDRFDVRVESVDQIRARIDFRILGRHPRSGESAD